MDNNFMWLVAYAYTTKLISREEFIRHWKNIQEIEALLKDL